METFILYFIYMEKIKLLGLTISYKKAKTNKNKIYKNCLSTYPIFSIWISFMIDLNLHIVRPNFSGINLFLHIFYLLSWYFEKIKNFFNNLSYFFFLLVILYKHYFILLITIIIYLYLIIHRFIFLYLWNWSLIY